MTEAPVGGDVEEGIDSEVSITVGPVGFSGPINVSGDTANLDKTGDASVNSLLNPAAVGHNLKVRGRVRGRAVSFNGANEGKVTIAKTEITTYLLTKTNGGTHADCPEGADHVH